MKSKDPKRFTAQVEFELYPDGAMSLRNEVGTATCDGKEEVEMTTNMDMSPLLKYRGRFVHLSWNQLVAIAMEIIDKELDSAQDSDSRADTNNRG